MTGWGSLLVGPFCTLLLQALTKGWLSSLYIWESFGTDYNAGYLQLLFVTTCKKEVVEVRLGVTLIQPAVLSVACRAKAHSAWKIRHGWTIRASWVTSHLFFKDGTALLRMVLTFSSDTPASERRPCGQSPAHYGQETRSNNCSPPNICYHSQ